MAFPLAPRVVLTLAAFLAAPLAVTAQPLRDDAARAVEAGDWPAVVKAITAAAGKTPTGDSAYWLAVALGETGKTNDATKLLEPAWKEAPTDRALSLALLNYANVNWLAKRRNSEFPLAMYDEELARALLMARIRVIRAAKESDASFSSYLSANDAIAAWESYRMLGGEPDALMKRWAGFAFLQSSRFGEAAALLADAAASLPASWDHALDLAVAYLRSGHPDAGQAWFDRAVALAPAQAANDRGGASRRAACMLSWAQAQSAAGRHADAVAAYRALLAHQPNMESVRHAMGLAAYRAGDRPLALWAFKDSLEIDGIPDSGTWIGRCLVEMGEYESARIALENTLERLKGGEQKPSPTALHYLGRALWGLDRKEDAIKRLAEAHQANPSDEMFARWCYQAALAADDPYAALEACERFGRSGRRAEALEGIEEVLRRWPTPRFSDMTKGRTEPHTRTAARFAATLCYDDGRFHSALQHLKRAGSTSGNTTNALTPWLFYLTGEYSAAERTGATVTRLFKDAYWPEMGRLAQGAALLALNRPSEVAVVVAPVKEPRCTRSRDTLRFHASLAEGKPDAAVTNTYTALGVLDRTLLGEYEGLLVLTVLPGSPLATAELPIRPLDRLIELESIGRLGTAAGVDAALKAPVPSKPLKLRFKRDGISYETTVDFSAIVAKLPPPGEPTKGANP